ncbi:uncharacterized protein FA14DRAFT_162613 [Meira miltonrushii]|uniref:Midasin n=1 Tax=Meira miltonrushii TaxID=1280837 RepID=A0A316V647_9BASI|nr:uncharacterized protein FA14DRAFT_162613 [Meira miltonrushii]PWN31683.1 hypothetical protein FA14DRAFT_162613 [Meira miltonrushii]
MVSKLVEEMDVRITASRIYEQINKDGIPSWRPVAILGQWAQASTPSTPQSDLLDALAELLMHPQCTEIVAQHAGPLLIDLFAKILHRFEASYTITWSNWQVIHAFYALAVLLPSHPELQPLVLDMLHLPQLEWLTPQNLTQKQLGPIFLSSYRIINVSPITIEESPHFLSTTNLLSLVQLQTTTPALRLLAIRLLARIENVPESTLNALISQHVGQPGTIGSQLNTPLDASLRVYMPTSNYDQPLLVEEVDLWVLPLLEMDRIQQTKERFQQQGSPIEEQSSPSIEQLDQTCMESTSVLFGGRFFYRTNVDIEKKQQFKETESLQPVLSALSEKLRKRLPILISGPEACGKTSLIRHSCDKISNDTSTAPIVWLQLADQSGIDAKSLIGSFISSPTRPGNFEWTEGALSRAVRLGKWVVLEDIDKANVEVLSVIKPLVEGMAATKTIGARPYLDLGPRGKIRAGKGFAIFATRTVARSDATTLPVPTFYGNHHWTEVRMNALRQEDILDIVTTNAKYLSMAEDGSVERLVSTWSKLANAALTTKSTSVLASSSAGTARIPSLHDLLKWCRRVDRMIAKGGESAANNIARAPFANQALQEEIALEAIDIFLGATPPPPSVAAAGTKLDDDSAQKYARDRFSVLLEILAQEIGVEASSLWHNVRDRRPEMRLQSANEDGTKNKSIQIGRWEVLQAKRHNSTLIAKPSASFAMTGSAARLLERIVACVAMNEPTLLVGETGTGKTTVVQQLAAMMQKPLVALNLSQQTESADLLGGFKPLDPKLPAMDLHNDWLDLFQRTFSLRRNARYLQAERKALQSQKWSRLHATWTDSVRLAYGKLKTESLSDDTSDHIEEEDSEQRARKTMRTSEQGDKQNTQMENGDAQKEEEAALLHEWKGFEARLSQFAAQYTGSKRALVFSFVEGPLVKAIRDGTWVLLDEINLATSETLECLSTLLQTPESSIVLSEKGDLEPVPRHPDFRLFACMNPATDVGKKDLPNNLRSRFTEIYAISPDVDREALIGIVESYIGADSIGDRGAVMDVADCFVMIKQLTHQQKLADGANQRPHYSIRTLARALTFAKDTSSVYGLRRALFEGFIMAFTMLLDQQSGTIVRDILKRNILDRAKNAKAAASFVPPRPASSSTSTSHIQIGSFWLETGSQPAEDVPEYILTTSVQEKLVGLARAALTRRSPVLIQGPTSAGKTSAVEYLARRTGHRFVRINNHEHTDLQEYLGSYTTDSQTGRLAFQEGLLVTAARRGDWIVLDELNLAPTDVLEALNRLLDDNRELLIPETGEVIKPHPHFMLFATQNPPGLYAGRKVLSRAFRNRFLEIHFDDVPQAELQTILARRCRIAPSYADKIVRVFLELQRRRQTTRVFDTKQAFVTLRDLFRWGMRQAEDYNQLALNGYMLIAERTRKPEDGLVVKQVLEEVLKVKIDLGRMYDIFDQDRMSALLGANLASSLGKAVEGTGIVWTSAMRRLVCLVACALRYSEPVLLVGETGTGKTSVCEVLSNVFSSSLVTVNCHQNTDAADLLGGQRPIRNRTVLRETARASGLAILQQHMQEGNVISTDSLEAVADALSKLKVDDVEEQKRIEEARMQINQSMALFEWHDGPLVDAMRNGYHMLLDEISLADDSVLERLNSVFEPGRTLVLAERASSSASDSVVIKADAAFQVVATMNPGGDYGKKELSPALRNRFTEVWVPAVTEREDILAIIDAQWSVKELQPFGHSMIEFVNFYSSQIGGSMDNNNSSLVGLRDLISWAAFMNMVMANNKSISPSYAFAHGALMTLIDGLPLHPWIAAKPKRQIEALVNTMVEELVRLSGLDVHESQQIRSNSDLQIMDRPDAFGIGGFLTPKGHLMNSSGSNVFNLQAQTPANNAMRVLKAMQVSNRAIMLEGSPGAGKTSLIVALANACRHPLTRINLSDQTELSDLFGADLPIEGGKPGEFGWREAAFLQAMQSGAWVLLDEMNLASQSVLEGLNSCLDHRGTVYVPELGRTFQKHPNFRFFAAQNPQHQGGGRKGLPKSFLNRFTKVYIEELRQDDFLAIMHEIYPAYGEEKLQAMVHFNDRLQILLRDTNAFSKNGHPWEFNLRDLLRWLEMSRSQLGLIRKERRMEPMEYFNSLYTLRFRTEQDRKLVAMVAAEVFGHQVDESVRPWFNVTSTQIQLGHVLLPRTGRGDPSLSAFDTFTVSQTHLAVAQALGECIQLAWPAILVGKGGAGKSSLVRKMAQLMGKPLQEVRLNGGTDAIDIVGGFEQVDSRQGRSDILMELKNLIDAGKQNCLAMTEQQDQFSTCMTLKQMSFILDQQRDALSANEFFNLDWQRIAEVNNLLLCLGILSQIDRARGQRLLDTIQIMATSPQDINADSGRFAWKDGPVISAMRKGQWLLMDEANLCPASVLDRLNSLLEPGGSIVLSERGVISTGRAGETSAIEIVKPHPDFRIFFAIDPKYGELSRAMRNRGMELFLEDWTTVNPALNIQEASLQCISPYVSGITPTGRFLDHDQHAAMAILGRSIGQIAIGYASHYHASELYPALDCLHGHQSLQEQSFELKSSLMRKDDISEKYLRDIGPDLQSWPSLLNDQSNSIEESISRLMGIVVNAACSLIELQRYQRSQESGAEEMTVLTRSAMSFDGAEIELIASEEKYLFELLWTIMQTVSSIGFGGHVDINTISKLESVLASSLFLAGKNASQARVNNSVSRVVYNQMRRELVHLNKAFNDQFGKVLTLLDASGRQVLLRTGHAFNQIWQAFLPNTINEESTRMARKIQEACANVREYAPSDLIANATEIVALLMYDRRDRSEFDQKNLSEMATRILIALEGIAQAEQPSMPRTSLARHESDNILLSLIFINMQLQHNAIKAKSSAQLLEAGNGSFPLSCAVTMHSIPFAKSDQIALTRGQFEWLASLPSASVVHDGENASTQQLFQPVVLRAILDACNSRDRIALQDIEARHTVLDRMKDLVSYLAPAELMPRSHICAKSLENLLQSLVPFLLDALQDEEESDLSDEVQSSIQEIECATLLGLPDAFSALLKCSNLSARIKNIANNWLNCFQAMQTMQRQTSNNSKDDVDQLRILGSAFLHVALAMFALFVPNVAIDPVITQQTKKDLLEYQIQRLRAERAALVAVESSVTGNVDSVSIKMLDQRIAQLAGGHSSQRVENMIEGANLASRTTRSEFLNQLHSEMWSFVDQIFTKKNVQQLTGARFSDAQATNIQSTVNSMIVRLQSRYDDLQDLTTPFCSALSIVQVGLGMLRQSETLSKRSNLTHRIDSMVEALVTFPTSASTKSFLQKEVPIRLKPGSAFAGMVVPLILSKLEAIVLDVQNGHPLPSILGPLTSCYDQIWHLWTLDQEAERQRRADESSLYKTRTLDIQVEEDAELQEKEFANLFPQYQDIMEEMAEKAETNGTASEPNGKRKRGKKAFVDDSDVQQLFQLHLTLFSSAHTAASNYKQSRVEHVHRLMLDDYVCMSESLDKHSASLQIGLLDKARKEGESDEATLDKLDFYVDACPSESKKLQTLVLHVQERLRQLIKDWPDQQVLQHIFERCEAMLQLDTSSPVNKLLAALEGLLVHTEDWQMYASSKTTLQPQRDAITSLIIEWRRLELHGWKRLLEKEQRLAYSLAKDWWFTLFQATIKSDSEEDNERTELVTLLDQFLRGSPLGQFSGRLNLLKAMHSYHVHLGGDKGLQFTQSQKKVQAMLFNIIKFFSQFAPTVEEHLDKKRAVVEREIADFVRLASWKDTNVHALKTSATKTHRKLHQCLRKFRHALAESIDPLLANVGPTREGKKANEPIAVISARDLAPLRLPTNASARQEWHLSEKDVPLHLINLETTASTLHRIFNTSISKPMQNQNFAEGVTDLSNTIVERSSALSKATPFTATEENTKLVKNLETRKRKAWSDLLKELRRLGFTTTACEGMSNKFMSDSAFVLSLEGLKVDQGEMTALINAENQYYRLLAMLPLLRSAVSNRERNPDVDAAQLQLALSYVENGFMFANANRSRLRDLRTDHIWFKAVNERIQHLLEAGTVERISGTQTMCEKSLLLHADFWARTTAGLLEIATEAPVHAQFSPVKDLSVNSEIDEIQALAVRASSHKKSFLDLVKVSQLMDSSLVTSQEVERAKAAEQDLTEIISSLDVLVHRAVSLRALTKPMLAFLQNHSPQEKIIFDAQTDADKGEEFIGKKSDDLVSSILIVAQDLRQVGRNDRSEEDLMNRALTEETKAVASYQQKLRLMDIKEAVSKVISSDSLEKGKINSSVVQISLQRLQPFLDTYISMLDALAVRTTQTYASLMDLNVTICSLVNTLASKGFCKPRPPEQNQDAADAQNDDDQQLEDGGVGLGDGEGAKDVTDTLRDDEEMEELQKDENDEQDKDEDQDGPKGEKNAREMDQDFDGELGDVEEEDGEDGEEEKPEDEKEMEDAVGDVDPLDLDTVDEKTWAGKDEEDEKDQEGGKDQNEKEMDGKDAEGDGEEHREAPKASSKDDQNGAEGAGQREEKREGKEGEEGQDEEGGNEEEGDDDQKPTEDDQAEGEDGEGEENEEDPTKAEGMGRAIDQEAQQGDNLDLDEDLKMDEDAQSVKDDGSDFEDMDDLSENDQRDDRKELTPDLQPDAEEEDAQGDVEQQVERAEGDDEDAEMSGQEDDEEKPDVPGEKGEDAADEDDDENAQDNAEKKQEGDDGPQPQPSAADQGSMDGQAEAEAAAAGDAEQDAPAQQEQSSRSQSGRQRQGGAAAAQNQVGEEEKTSQDIDDSNSLERADQQNSADAGQQKQEQGQTAQDDPTQSGPQDQDEAPARSLGDALKDFKRNLDAIEERLSKEAKQDGEGPSADEDEKAAVTQVEHIDEDEDSEMQALGAAKEEEAQQRRADLTGAMDTGDDEEMKDEPDARPPAEEQEDVEDATADLMPEKDKSDDNAAMPKSSRGLMGTDLRQDDREEPDVQFADEAEMEDEKVEEIENPEDLEIEIRAAMEDLAEEKDDDKRLALAQDLWKMYTSATTDYAFTLSEQLRLILTPTKATKLTGDFKTGKRLNMRKIIPFIASDYVKDKIWLRRHQPQAREYQVLLCIDDSKSMADSANRTLAFKSLALVCSALQKLEVGQVGVMKFGRQAELLKGFEAGSSETVGDVQGSQIFAKLPFDQKGTNMLHLLRNSYDVLVDARAQHGQSQSAGPSQQLWQLQIIISDGVCQDHEGLRAMLRRAAEAHIMVVFVILDSIQQQSGNNNGNSSILTMNSVEYKMDAAGRPQLNMKRYLDTFPFDYFVVVQDVADLPDVLSNTLRQWAQRIAEM